MLFKEQGLDTSKMIFESQSRNTYENAVFTLFQDQLGGHPLSG